MGAATTPARTCPECGTVNTGPGLFCAECGSSLTSATIASDSDGQTTSLFRPVTDASTADPYATQQFRPQPSLEATSGTASTVSSYRYDNGLPAESRRGLVLGWVAGVLILLVIAWLGWTSYLDSGTRDSIIGWFS